MCNLIQFWEPCLQARPGLCRTARRGHNTSGISHCSSRRLQFPTFASCLRKTCSETTVVLHQLLGLSTDSFLLLVRLHTHSQTWRHRRPNERLTIADHNKGRVQDSPVFTYTIKCNYLSIKYCSVLEVWETVFDWVSILWGEGTPNDGMRETVWVLGKYPNDAV